MQKDHRSLVITANNVAANSNLNTIENYIKNVNIVESDNIMSLGLPQSKSYLKILGIPYYIENTNLLITTDIIERVLQTTHIFNNTILTSYLHIIKTSPKSNIAIIWIDIWDSQSSSKVKNLINRYFNISSHITII